MNKKEERKHRNALTLFVIAYIFIIMTISILISFGLVAILLSTSILPVGELQKVEPQQAIFIMMVISLIVGLFIISISSHIYLKYVNVFINQMNRLASGDFAARLDYGDIINLHPTVREITSSFNTLAEELESTKMMRGDFINNFSHEFKTPIVSIAGFAKLLKHGNLTEEQKREYLDVIEEESLRLSTMATNVLNMTKVENQTILTDITKFNLSEQIRSCVLLMENMWTNKNIEFSLEFDEFYISANEELLKHVWMNLISNAIKFSPDYGLIVIRIMKNGNELEISVANSGPEIPEDSKKRIFDKFYQADESHSSEGNGIGLAIVKKVLELHSGDIEVECKNGITTFIVNIPE